MSDYHKQIEQAVEKYNTKLATISTFSELQELRTEMDADGLGLRFIMITKTGGEENGIFKVDDVTVEYITTRTNKVYRSKIKNLHRVMQVHY